MYKSFYALEKNTRQEYFKSSDDLRTQILSFSPKEILDGKREILLLSNIMALPGEVDMEDFKAPKLYTVDEDGTANIKVSGILSTQVDWCAAYFNEATTTYGFIRAAALEADEDPEVKKIRFNVSTPGGIVTDLDFTSQVIWNIKKPTETIGFGMVASAGIYLFSQTDKLISADPSVFWGSIGVACSYIDRSKADKEDRVVRREMASDDAPDKRPDMSTDEGKAVLKRELNDLHKIFVGRVATGRKVTSDFVNKNFGQGGVLIAEDALKAGLIDQVDLQLNQASEPAKKSAKRTSAKIETEKEEKHMDPKTMTLDEYLAQNTAAKVLNDQRLADAKKESHADGKKEGIAEKQADIDRVHPLISAEGASPALIKSGFEALKGVVSVDTFVGIASYETRQQEALNAKEADKDQEGDTTLNADAGNVQNGKVKNAEGMKEIAAEMKGDN